MTGTWMKVAVLAAAACATGAWAEDLKVGTTLDNLQAAFNGESNAKARYEAFAAKADAEGYKQVANLFRAASKAESIHAGAHGKVIEGLNAKPVADVKPADVKSTKENLEAALKGETYEMTTMYPAFIAQAEKDGNKKAVRSFKGAMAAEKEHAKLYKEALDNLDAWKNVTKVIIVCERCGYTTTDVKIKKCPVCSEPRDGFIEFK